MKSITYTKLRQHLWSMPIESSVKAMVIAMVFRCEALKMTVEECVDMIANSCDEPQEKPKPLTVQRKLTAQVLTAYKEGVADFRKQCVDMVIERDFNVMVKWSGFYEWVKIPNEQFN